MSEFICRLSRLNHQVVSALRLSLFIEAHDLGLLEGGDEPVTHRKSHHGKSVKTKHAEDVWALVCSIKNNTPHAPVSHVLLKNGKRSASRLDEQSRRNTISRCSSLSSSGEGNLTPNDNTAAEASPLLLAGLCNETQTQNGPLNDDVFKLLY